MREGKVMKEHKEITEKRKSIVESKGLSFY
jgi:hypothetical protein